MLVAAALRARPSRTPTPRLLEEIADDPAAVAAPPAAAQRRRGVAELVRERLGRGRRARRSSRPATRPPAATRCCSASCSRRCAAEGVEPDAAARRRGPRHRPARGVAHGAAAAGAAAGRTRSRSRARSRCSGDGAGLPAIAALAGLDEADAAAEAVARAGAAPRSCGPSRRSASCTRSSATRSTTSSPPAERELQHERAARGADRTLGAAPEQRGGAAAASCRAAREPWVADAAARGRPRRAAARRRRERRRLPAPRARGAAAGGASAPRCCSSSGWRRRSLNGRPPSSTCGRRTSSSTDPLRAGAGRRRCSRGCCCSRGPPQEAVAVARRADRGAARPSSPTSARALEAFELYAASTFGADVPDARCAARARSAAARRRTGPARRCSRPSPRGTGRCGGGTARRSARELALAALADGALHRRRPGLFMAVVADRRARRSPTATRRSTRWDAAMARPTAAARCSRVCGVDLWRGWTLAARGELAEAEDAAAPRLDGDRACGDHDRRGHAYATALLARCCSSAATSPARAAALRAAARPRRRLRRRRAAAPAADEPSCCSREGRWPRRSPTPSDVATGCARASTTRRGRRGGRSRRWRSTASGEPTRRSPCSRRSSSVARRWGAPGTLGRTLRVLGTLGGDEGLDLLHEAVAPPRARRRGSSTPRRWPRSARRCGARGSRPRRASRCGAALELAGRAARGRLAEHVRDGAARRRRPAAARRR